MALMGWVTKRPSERVGGWRRRARKVGCVKQGDLRAGKRAAQESEHS